MFTTTQIGPQNAEHHVLDSTLRAVILLCERNLFSSHTKWTWSLSSELFSSLFSSLLHCSVCGLFSLQRVQKMPWLESRFCMHTMWSTTALELYTLHDISNIHEQMFSWALLFQSDRNLLAINPFWLKTSSKSALILCFFKSSRSSIPRRLNQCCTNEKP